MSQTPNALTAPGRAPRETSNTPQTEKTIDGSVFAGFKRVRRMGTLIFALIITVLFSLIYYQHQRSAEAVRSVDHTRQVIAYIDALRTYLLNVDNAVRKYAESQDPAYRDPGLICRQAQCPSVAHLINESIRNPQLHSKYWKILTKENLRMAALTSEYDALKLDKYEFYTLGPTQEQIAKVWKLPPRGQIIKSEVVKYLQSDKDLVEISIRIVIQREKIAFLESIIDNLNRRSFFIKNKIDFERFRNGEI